MTQLTNEQIISDILPWIEDKTRHAGIKIEPDTDLITDNLLDSMEFLELVSFLEKKFKIELDADALTPENFKTPTDIAALVESAIG